MTNPPESESGRLPWVDLARGLAAFAVAAGHLRYLMFEGLEQDDRLFWRFFDLLTAQGHAAVIVFFVLSGFLVGGSVHNAICQSHFSWPRYWIQRLTRLWLVLLPALALTALLDALGRDVIGGSLYTGLLASPSRGGSLPDGEAIGAIWSASTFLGNALFLQRIAVPTFGTNSPLWSLSYEFWYYAIFPLVMIAAHRQQTRTARMSSAILASLICAVLPLKVVVYGVFWGLGYAAFLAGTMSHPVEWRQLRGAWLLPSLIFAAVLFWLPGALRLTPAILDAATAGSFALVLWALSARRMNSIPAALSRRMADFSYTLYLTHFPFLALVMTAFNDAELYVASSKFLLIYCFILTCALAYAWCAWWLFERHTRSVQRLLNRSLSKHRTA